MTLCLAPGLADPGAEFYVSHARVFICTMDYEKLDPAILAALPAGCEVLSVTPFGKTRWSIGLRVVIQIGDEEEACFLKIIERAEWTDMARAEFESQQALSKVIPDNVIIPYAWGFFEGDTSRSFYLACFRRLLSEIPSTAEFLSVIKKLHQTSASPTGRFGFHCTTYWGPPPNRNDWTDSWEEWWGRQLHSDVVYTQEVYGKDQELADLTAVFIEKVVARLLRPLQTGGRSIKPSLCHGDLWDGNVKIDRDTRQIVLYDSCSFYGHAEVDLQAIGEPRYNLRMDVVKMYETELGASEPQEDFYDRHELYGIRNDVVIAAISPDQKSLLEVAKEKMRKLLEKFPDGYEGFEELDGVN